MVLAVPCGDPGTASDAVNRRTARTSTRRGVASLRVAKASIISNSAQWQAKGDLLQFATWNVRSLLNFSGPVQTAYVAQRPRKTADDRRIDVVVDELERLDIEVAGLQETRWFGDALYHVGDAMVLSSGRPTPVDGENFRRGEGVAIVVRGRALVAWRAGGCQWKALSSRLGMASLQFARRDGKPLFIHVVVCYAPTFGSPRSAKDVFLAQLQATLQSIPATDKFVILGDFNARVGSRDQQEDLWDGVRGPHGFGVCNDAGKELLSFLSMNNGTIANTWFCKKPVFKQSWQHPCTKKWHSIDFIVVHQRDRRLCQDCRVVCSADCGSDHRLVCLTFHLDGLRLSRHTRSGRRFGRFNVSSLRTCTGVPLSKDSNTTHKQFQKAVTDAILSAPSTDCTIEDRWTVLQSALVTAAEKHLGTTKRRQPDWFADSQEVLSPLIDERRHAYNSWVQSGSPSDHAKFKKVRSKARAAVRCAKTRWLECLAAQAEASRTAHDGKKLWDAIKSIQRSHQGLRPTPVPVIRDEQGDVCMSLQDQCQRWQRHFQKVLNLESSFDITVFDSLVQRPVHEDLARLSPADELHCALANVPNNRAAGPSGILPEMVKCAGPIFFEHFYSLICQVWEHGKVPQDWRDAELVPIPKKGDLSCCDNWRGIALLDVVGKVVGRLIQNRLQELAEDVLPESRCGFRRGRSCTDQIFAATQVVEKFYEHRTKGHLIFVDLKKAYNSVPRAALWKSLAVLGVPPVLINLLSSFHSDMSARVRVGGTHSDPIAINNGLRQGCAIAPVLFNLYFSLVLEKWLAAMQVMDCDGVPLKVNINGHLFNGPRSQHHILTLTDLEFADDAVLIALERTSAQVALTTFDDVCSQFGLCVSIPKTKFMVCGANISPEDRLPLMLRGQEVQCVPSFVYLGSLTSSDTRISGELDRRLASAARAFGAIRGALDTPGLSLRTKKMLYTACVLSVLLYGSECWTILRRDEARLDIFHHQCLRVILGVSRKDQQFLSIPNVELRRRYGDPEPLSSTIRCRRLEWIGHLARMEDNRIQKQLLFGWLGKARPPEGPRLRWKDRVHADLRQLEVQTWYQAAQDRQEWRVICHTLPPDDPQQPGKVCNECHRSFKSSAGLKRHKCTAERLLPVSEQSGSKFCAVCQHWFRSAGGLKVHKCKAKVPAPPATLPSRPPPTVSQSCCQHHCIECDRCFKSLPGFKRHNCERGKKRPDSDARKNFEFACDCGRRFRRKQDLARHVCHP